MQVVCIHKQTVNVEELKIKAPIIYQFDGRSFVCVKT